MEERVELGQLEQGAQVLIQVGQTQLAPLLANLLRQADQDAEPRGIDVARIREIDQELARAGLELFEDFLLELLAVAHDELSLNIDYRHVVLLLHIEAHLIPQKDGLSW